MRRRSLSRLHASQSCSKRCESARHSARRDAGVSPGSGMPRASSSRRQAKAARRADSNHSSRTTRRRGSAGRSGARSAAARSARASARRRFRPGIRPKGLDHGRTPRMSSAGWRRTGQQPALGRMIRHADAERGIEVAEVIQDTYPGGSAALRTAAAKASSNRAMSGGVSGRSRRIRRRRPSARARRWRNCSGHCPPNR
jgi:hypothetical protein